MTEKSSNLLSSVFVFIITKIIIKRSLEILIKGGLYLYNTLLSVLRTKDKLI